MTSPDTQPLQTAEAAALNHEALNLGTLSIWPALRLATDQGKVLELTSTEFNILVELAKQVGNAVSKESLYQRVLGRTMARYDRSIDMHIYSIRKKLQRLPDGRARIHTVARQGFQLIPG
jgi:two-component system, OmpR family, response regulator